MSTALKDRGPFAYTCHVCKVEFYDGRVRSQNTCKAELCQRERHRVEEWHHRRMQKQREIRQAKPKPEKKERDGTHFTDERAQQIWNAKYGTDELAYHGAPAMSPKQRQEWQAKQAARVAELREGMGL